MLIFKEISCNWPFLKKLSERGEIDPIELIFAERMLGQVGCTSEGVGALLVAMMAGYRRGDLCFDPQEGNSEEWKELIRQGCEQIPEEICEAVAGEGVPLKPICLHGGKFYFQKNWVYETRFLQHFLRVKRAKSLLPIEKALLPEALNREQRDALELVIDNAASIITGGPGTGKTFTAAHLVKHCLKGLSTEDIDKFRVVLTAPTGKAVTHLEKQIGALLEEDEKKGLRSGTLHALLELREDGSQRREVVLLADLIIVDESSMIDAKMYALLFGAIITGTRVVLLGDEEQLPAIDAGCFFADLIEAGCPAVKLKESHRVEQQELRDLAEGIKRGEMGRFAPFIERNWEKNIYDMACSHYRSFFAELPRDRELLGQFGRFRMLSCLRQGKWGVDQINRAIEGLLAKECPQKGWWAIPIMITRNDYRAQLYNGDMGVLMRKIDAVGKREDFALFEGRKPIPALSLPSFDYAYCLSVHKSQGSEYETVALLIPEGSERFGREILYTAVTRARKELKVLAHEGIIDKMIRRTIKRKSGLVSRIRDCL
jgi:exodeoxyribonuclease V alpha subunit